MALGQGAGQERGQTHGCPWIWKRLVGVSSSCQVASLAEPLPAVGQSSPSCTSSARACQTVGLTSFTCFFYIHGTNSFWGLPVPPGGRRLPLRELVFFRPLTLALAPLVPQGLLHCQVESMGTPRARPVHAEGSTLCKRRASCSPGSGVFLATG